MSRSAQAAAYLRENARHMAVELVVNFLLPLLIYRATKGSLGEVKALMASSAPPIAWSLVTFVRQRKLDALSLLVLTGIVLSLLAYVGGGGPRMLQLREKLVTGLIGLIFLGSAVIRRPLIYQLARATLARKSADELAQFESRRGVQAFERIMMIMTVVWGLGLVAEAALAAVLVFRLSVQQFMVVGPMLGYGTMGSLSLWTAWYARRARRRGDARRAAEAAEAASNAA